MKHSVLHEIAENVKVKLEERRKQVSHQELEKKLATARTPHPFASAFLTPGIHTIAEVKFKSPALGVLESASLATATQIAKSYLEGGATAISVLTEETYFHGNLAYLKEIRKLNPSALLLMKDFILEEYQIMEGLCAGADAILLIVSLLGIKRVRELMNFAQKLGLSALIEVHDEQELRDALSLDSSLIGINNRNLKTLEVNITTSFDLLKTVEMKAHPKTAFISESGIKTAQEMKALHQAGFSGFLIGSTLMTSSNPGESLEKLLHEAAS